MDDVLAAIQQQLGAGRTRPRVEPVRELKLDLELDGFWYPATISARRIELGLAPTDGFELALRWVDSGDGATTPRPVALDDSFLVETNDPALAAAWLDDAARAAVLESRYVAPHGGDRAIGPLIRDTSWSYAIAGGVATASRVELEPDPARIASVLAATLVLAAAPVRWAVRFGRLAPELGGQPAPRIEIGGQPALRIPRGQLAITVRMARRLVAGDPGRLRTLVSAHRHVSGGDTLSLIADRLPRAAHPPALDGGGRNLHVDERAERLLDFMHASAAMVRDHDVEIAFDGVMADSRRLEAAIELAAHWAVDGTIPPGPYR